MSADPYAHWRACLAGDEAGKVSQHEGDFQAGFWRAGDRPIAIFHDAQGNLVGHDGKGAVSLRALETAWPYCKAVTEAQWREVAEHDGRWPDEPPALPTIGHNLPSDPFEAMKVELEAEEDAVAAFLAQPIGDQIAADRAGLWSKRVGGLADRFEALRVERKRPHDDAAKAVQVEFTPFITKAKGLVRRLKDAMDPFLRAKLERERAAMQAKAENAEALEVSHRQPAKPKASAGGVAMRATKHVEFDDFAAAVAFLGGVPSLRADLDPIAARLTKKLMDVGVTVPGARIVTRETVA